MSYHPSKVNGGSGAEVPSGIVYYGHSPSDPVYVADSSFNIGGGYLSATNIKVSNGGTIGSQNTPDAITIAANGDISILKNLSINGTLTTVNTDNLIIKDPLMLLASGNVNNNHDIGFFGQYKDGTNNEYAGLFRDASDGKFRLFHSLEDIPTTTIDINGTGYTKGILVADLEGNADTATILQSGRYIGVADQVTGSGFFNGSSDVIFNVQLTADAINDQTESTTANNTDYIIIASGTSLRKITKQNFVSDLGGGTMSSFVLEDGDGTEVTINDGKEVKFVGISGVTINWTDTDNGTDADPYDLTFSVDHDQTLNYLANEHINHTGVVLTAGDGLSGGGDISASRTFAIDISEYAATGVGAGDSFLMLDSDGSTEQRSTVDQLGTYMAGTNITNTSGVLSIPDSTIDGVIFEAGNFIDGTTIDFTVNTGTSVTAEVKDNSITESKRSRTIETITSSKTADKDITLVNATSSSITVSLPENATAGRIMIVKRIDSNAESGPYDVLIQRTGSDTIDGSSTTFQLYYQNETLTFVSDGSNWFII